LFWLYLFSCCEICLRTLFSCDIITKGGEQASAIGVRLLGLVQQLILLRACCGALKRVIIAILPLFMILSLRAYAPLRIVHARAHTARTSLTFHKDHVVWCLDDGLCVSLVARGGSVLVGPNITGDLLHHDLWNAIGPLLLGRNKVLGRGRVCS